MEKHTKDEARVIFEAAIQYEIDDPKNQEYERTERSHLHSSDESFFVVGRNACRTIMLADLDDFQSELESLKRKIEDRPFIINDDENKVEHKGVLVVYDYKDDDEYSPSWHAVTKYNKEIMGDHLEMILLEDF